MVQGLVDAVVGVVAVARLVALEEGGVRSECRRVRAVAERLLGPAQLGLQCAQIRESQVYGVLDGGGRGQGDGLRQIADAVGGEHGQLAAVRAFLTRDEPQERGLAGAVVADETGLLARLEGEGDLVEDGTAGVALGDVLQGEL